MLGAFGMGAVIGALNIAEVRKTNEWARPRWRACALCMGGAIAAVSAEPGAGADRGGAGWLPVAVWNARGRAVQHRRAALGAAAGSRADRWRHSRPPLAGGIAMGSWGWGRLTDAAGVENRAAGFRRP